MKVVIVSAGISGGAGIAAYRLHKGLRNKGVQSNLITENVSLPEEHIFSVKAHFIDNKINQLWYKLKYALLFRKHHKHFIDWSNSEGLINFPVSIWMLHRHPLIRQADIINIHWFGDLIKFPSFFNKLADKKIIWTLHDMSLFTAGCQYSKSCGQYATQCSKCPYTSSQNLLHQYFRLKEDVFQNAKSNHHVVVLNSWMKNQAELSPALNDIPIEIIYNGIDEIQYAEENKIAARKKLGLPENKVLGLFIAQNLNNERKGGSLLQVCLKRKELKDFAVIAVGAGSLDTGFVECIHMGEVSTPDLLRLVYSASDFLIHAALIDNLPNTVIESLLCGRPVLGFNQGGLPDMINKDNGILIQDISPEALYEGIYNIMETLSQYDATVIRKHAVTTFGINSQVGQYINLFKRAISN